MKPALLAFLLILLFTCPAIAQTAIIDSLQKIIALDKKDSTEAAANLSLAGEFARSDMAAAKRCCTNAAAISNKLNLFQPLSAAYSMLVTFNAQTDKVDSARYYLDLLKKLADKHPINKIQANYNFTAGLFYRKQGNYKASQPYMLEDLRLTTIQGNRLAMAGQNLNIGNNYLDMSEYQNAMACHLKALNLFEALGNKRGMSLCYSAIGGDFISLSQYIQALPYIQRSIALKDELNDKRGKAASYLSLGEIQEGLGHPEKALESYRQALALNKAIHLSIEEAKTELNIGKLYAAKKDIRQATSYLNASRDLFKSLGDTTFLATINAEMVGLQKSNAVQDTDEKTFINTLAISRRMGDKNTEINNYKYLSELYAKRKQYDKALIYNEKYHAEYDSVANTNLQLQVKKLEQQFNLERKEKEINLLKKDQLLDRTKLQNQKISWYAGALLVLMLTVIGLLVMNRYRIVQKTRRLVEIEQMRNHIARNLHDDIGSTLSSINILSKVALDQANGNVNVSRGLEKIKDSSFNIMENMSDIVWAINPANDPLDKTILKMREFAAAILEPAGIDFSFDENGALSDLKLSVDERKNFYLIFKEAINNIAKYSEASKADIVLQKTAHQFLLKIADNGKGFEQANLNSGNGLRNMRSRAGEMNAVFEIISKPVDGTCISVTLPIT